LVVLKESAMPTKLMKVCNRLAKLAVAGFFAGLIILFLPIETTTYNGVLVVSGVSVLLVSVATLSSSLIVRDMASSGWRFSVRAILIVMTVAAAGLGFAVYALR
jgi:hypothetical protein